MNKSDYTDFLQKGSDALQIFFENKYDSFTPNQQTELSFANQHSIIDSAHLTGKLDLADIDKISKTISVTDYKTGKPSSTWAGKTDYDKIKLHKYKQQLFFYKLLIENARDYRGYNVNRATIQFVEPTTSNDITALDTEFSDVELAHFAKLINAVWSHIISLSLPDISNYKSTYKGILEFEQDLIDGVI
jgi:DNA helicase-2/ATP-dependent DNA helicase PcrA